MYGLIWRSIPGPLWLRIMLCLLLAALVVVVLFEWVFPAVAPYVPFNDNTVSDTGGQ